MQTRQKEKSSPPTKRRKMTIEDEISLLKNTVDNLDSLVRELVDRVDTQTEQISILQGNHLRANNHTSIPNSQFMVIGSTGEQVHWWEQLMIDCSF